ADFLGGEFVLTEQRPRMQSRVEVVPLLRGDGVIFPVRHRPVQGTRGTYRVNVRHGVSRVRSGSRLTLGIIFHDAERSLRTLIAWGVSAPRAYPQPRREETMSGVRVLGGTRKGAFILTSDGKRQRWEVSGPHFGGWEISPLRGSPADPNRIYAS